MIELQIRYRKIPANKRFFSHEVAHNLCFMQITVRTYHAHNSYGYIKYDKSLKCGNSRTIG